MIDETGAAYQVVRLNLSVVCSVVMDVQDKGDAI